MKARKSIRWTHELQPQMTLEEVAAEIGVTRERVRQIENKAIEKLRAALDEKGITADDLRYGEYQATENAA